MNIYSAMLYADSIPPSWRGAENARKINTHRHVLPQLVRRTLIGSEPVRSDQTHLNRRWQFRCSLMQHVGDVLAGMLTSSEVRGDLPTRAGRNDTASKHARTFVRRLARLVRL